MTKWRKELFTTIVLLAASFPSFAFAQQEELPVLTPVVETASFPPHVKKPVVPNPQNDEEEDSFAEAVISRRDGSPLPESIPAGISLAVTVKAHSTYGTVKDSTGRERAAVSWVVELADEELLPWIETYDNGATVVIPTFSARKKIDKIAITVAVAKDNTIDMERLVINVGSHPPVPPGPPDPDNPDPPTPPTPENPFSFLTRLTESWVVSLPADKRNGMADAILAAAKDIRSAASSLNSLPFSTPATENPQDQKPSIRLKTQEIIAGHARKFAGTERVTLWLPIFEKLEHELIEIDKDGGRKTAEDVALSIEAFAEGLRVKQ